MDLMEGICMIEVGHIAINWVWFCVTLTWDGENFLLIFDFQPHPQAPPIVAQAGREPGMRHHMFYFTFNVMGIPFDLSKPGRGQLRHLSVMR